MKYLVAVDSSDNALEAFEVVLSIAHKEDEVVIFTVAEHEIVWLGVLECNTSLVDRARRAEYKGSKMLLVNFAIRCAQAGIKYKLVMSQGGNVGETICSACEKYETKCLAVGRRGMSPAKRLFFWINKQALCRQRPMQCFSSEKHL